MSADFKWEIAPIKTADQLSKGLRNKAIRIAMNKASAVVKNAVIAKVPVRYGYLKKSIKIKLKNYKNSAVWVSVVGPKSDFKRNKGKRKRGPKKGQPITHRPSNYAKLLEKGTKHAKAHPFLKPALDATKGQFMDTLRQKIEEQVNQLLPKK